MACRHLDNGLSPFQGMNAQLQNDRLSFGVNGISSILCIPAQHSSLGRYRAAPPFRTQHDFDKEAVGWHARSISRPILGLYLISFGIS